eukprot:TRINITY_DN14351_c0_g1_i1.p1 TRINITY_DN14351_c0_g1~~TRINITY_DN14351_c0_g1_i1.p1  ORF type:complete len:1866 (-),score=357.97 TRINITY_DN14351_c0_g1_i1:78-5507(-)
MPPPPTKGTSEKTGSSVPPPPPSRKLRRGSEEKATSSGAPRRTSGGGRGGRKKKVDARCVAPEDVDDEPEVSVSTDEGADAEEVVGGRSGGGGGVGRGRKKSSWTRNGRQQEESESLEPFGRRPPPPKAAFALDEPLFDKKEPASSSTAAPRHVVGVDSRSALKAPRDDGGVEGRRVERDEPVRAATEGEDASFWGKVTWGARNAIGFVSDVVAAINADTDDSETDATKSETKAPNPTPSANATTSAWVAPSAAASGGTTIPAGSGGCGGDTADHLRHSRARALDASDASRRSEPQSVGIQDSTAPVDDYYVDYVTQFCLYLGVDAGAEPELITEVDKFLKRPLPDGWTSHQTGEDAEFGVGYTYYVQGLTGRTQWTRPDEEDFLRFLCEKSKRPAIAGSRLFFFSLRDRTRRIRNAALEEKVSHLPELRPLLRALPEGNLDLYGSQPEGQESIIHVALHNQFPILHPAALEGFAAYFGLGCGTGRAELTMADLRQLWVAKLAALCPVPEGFEFRFDELSSTAVFVDMTANTASRHHPLDAFFVGLLERLLARHRSIEAAEAQRTGKPAALGGKVAFFIDASSGEPYWMRYHGNSEAASGPWGVSQESLIAASRSTGTDSATASILRGRSVEAAPEPRGVSQEPLVDPSQPTGTDRGAATVPPPGVVEAPKRSSAASPSKDNIDANDASDALASAAVAAAAAATAAAAAKAAQAAADDAAAAAAALEHRRGTSITDSSSSAARPGTGLAAANDPSRSSAADTSLRQSGEGGTARFGFDDVAVSGAKHKFGGYGVGTERLAVPPVALSGLALRGAAAGDTSRPCGDMEALGAARAPPATVAANGPATFYIGGGDDSAGDGGVESFREEAEGDVESFRQGDPLGNASAAVTTSASAGGDEKDHQGAGASGPTQVEDTHLAELTTLAERLRETSSDDTAALCDILQAMERVPATVDLLRETKLGILTQGHKDHPDKDVRMVARRLRRSWKGLEKSEVVNSASALPTSTDADVDAGGASAVSAPSQLPESVVATSLQAPTTLPPPPPPRGVTSALPPAPSSLQEHRTPAVTGASIPPPPKQLAGIPDSKAPLTSSPASGAPRAAPPPPGALPPPPLPLLPGKDLGPEEGGSNSNWSQKDGKWCMKGSRLSGDEDSGAEVGGRRQGGISAVKGARVGRGVKATIARLHAATATGSAAEEEDTHAGAEANPSGRPSGAVTASGGDEKGIGASGLTQAEGTHLAELKVLAERLRATSSDDTAALCDILQALERVPTTVALLRESQLGILTQDHKDHPDKNVRMVARRLRRSWKDLIHSGAGPPQASADGEAATDAEAKPVARPTLSTEALHGMAPPEDAEVNESSDSGESNSFDDDSTPRAEEVKGRPGVTATAPALPADPGAGVGTSLAARTVASGMKMTATVAKTGPPVSGEQPAAAAMAKRQRAQVVANLQWLCRLFLETREQLIGVHEGRQTEGAVCDGLREEMDVVRFKGLLEKALLSQSGGGPPKALVRLLRSFGERIFRGQSRVGGLSDARQAYEQFAEACAGTGGDGRTFVNVAVPRILRLFTRLIEEEKARGGVAASDEVGQAVHIDNPWLQSPRVDAANPGRGRGNTEDTSAEALDALLAGNDGSASMAQLEQEANAFLAVGAAPAPAWPAEKLQLPAPAAKLQSPGAKQRTGGTSAADAGGSACVQAPRGPRPQGLSASVAARRCVAARSPFFSGDPSLLVRVAKAPLPDPEGLVTSLVPGAEFVTEGLLGQFSDEELVMLSYVLEQAEQAASRRLVRELETRDELRSVCLHRREYLQLLENTLG